jgi:hypothetical protein
VPALANSFAAGTSCLTMVAVPVPAKALVKAKALTKVRVLVPLTANFRPIRRRNTIDEDAATERIRPRALPWIMTTAALELKERGIPTIREELSVAVAVAKRRKAMLRTTASAPVVLTARALMKARPWLTVTVPVMLKENSRVGVNARSKVNVLVEIAENVRRAEPTREKVKAEAALNERLTPTTRKDVSAVDANIVKVRRIALTGVTTRVPLAANSFVPRPMLFLIITEPLELSERIKPIARFTMRVPLEVKARFTPTVCSELAAVALVNSRALSRPRIVVGVKPPVEAADRIRPMVR